MLMKNSEDTDQLASFEASWSGSPPFSKKVSYAQSVLMRMNLVALFGLQNIDVRFIEYMPFDGNKWNFKRMVPYKEMLDTISAKYPSLHRIADQPHDTSKVTNFPLMHFIL